MSKGDLALFVRKTLVLLVVNLSMKLKQCDTNGCSLFAIPGENYCRPCKSRRRTKPDYLPEENPYNIKSQVDLFNYCWKTRKHKCFVTGQKLDKFYNGPLFYSIFAHVLRKSAYTKWRLDPDNIVFLSPNFRHYSVHRLFDDGVLSEILKFEMYTARSFKPLFLLEQEQLKKYETEFGRVMPLRKVTQQYLRLE